MKIGLRIEGAEALSQQLRALPGRVSRKMLVQALLEAGGPMRARISALAPRGRSAPHLADSLVLQQQRGSMEGGPVVRIGVTRDFFYGYFVELGTSKMAARPFVRPGFHASTAPAVDHMKRAIWAALLGRGIGSGRSGPRTGGGLL